MTPEQKKKLRKIYDSVATPEERRSLDEHLSSQEILQKTEQSSEKLALIQEEHRGSFDFLRRSVDGISKSIEKQLKTIPQLTNKTNDAVAQSSKQVSEKLDEVKFAVQEASRKEQKGVDTVSKAIQRYLDMSQQTDVSPIMRKIAESLSNTEESLSILPTKLGRFPQFFGLSDGTGNAVTTDVRGSSRTLAVEILDASGNQITTFGSSTVTANQGTPAVVANAWPTKLVDVSGVNVAAITSGRSAAGNGVQAIIGTYYSSRTPLTDGQADFLKLTTAGDLSVSAANKTTTASAPLQVSVGVASTALVPANASRLGLTITNTSSASVSLHMAGGTAVLNSGLTLYPGQTFEMSAMTFTTAAINAIASAAASVVGYQELV